MVHPGTRPPRRSDASRETAGRARRSARPAWAARVWLLVALLAASGTAAGAGAAAAPPPVEPDAPGGRIKVGVLVSLFTADHEKARSGTMGWWHVGVAKRLDDPQFELYAVVDPGTADDPRVRDVVREQFPPGPRDRMIEGDDAAALSRLGVVVAIRAWSVREPVIDALTRAVEGGVSLLSTGGFGMTQPGYTPAVEALNGFDDAEFLCPPGELPIEVFARRLLLPQRDALGLDAPAVAMLGRLDDLKLRMIGTSGRPRPGTIPVLTLTPESERRVFPGGPPAGKVFYPVALARLGKGHILTCNYHDPSSSLNVAADGNFHARAIQVLADLGGRGGERGEAAYFVTGTAVRFPGSYRLGAKESVSLREALATAGLSPDAAGDLRITVHHLAAGPRDRQASHVYRLREVREDAAAGVLVHPADVVQVGGARHE